MYDINPELFRRTRLTGHTNIADARPFPYSSAMDSLPPNTSISVPAQFEAAGSELPNEVVIIARWDDEHSRNITIQDFVRDGRAFIPVFSDEAKFKSQTKGSGFEDQGVVIRTDVLLSILHGGELLIIDPGGEAPRSITLPNR